MLIELSGKLGDAIYSLAVAKQLCDLHGIRPDLCFGGLYFSDKGKAALMPLRDQPYIGQRSFEFIKGADLNFSEFFLGYDHHPNIVREMMRLKDNSFDWKTLSWPHQPLNRVVRRFLQA